MKELISYTPVTDRLFADRFVRAIDSIGLNYHKIFSDTNPLRSRQVRDWGSELSETVLKISEDVMPEGILGRNGRTVHTDYVSIHDVPDLDFESYDAYKYFSGGAGSGFDDMVGRKWRSAIFSFIENVSDESLNAVDEDGIVDVYDGGLKNTYFILPKVSLRKGYPAKYIIGVSQLFNCEGPNDDFYERMADLGYYETEPYYNGTTKEELTLAALYRNKETDNAIVDFSKSLSMSDKAAAVMVLTVVPQLVASFVSEGYVVRYSI